jgi:hypothetical protein
MSPGATFERVYLALKASLVAGELRAGDPLEPKALGDDLSSSITPVRDALHRLVGERLVEAPRNDGFRVPVRSEAMVRDLYGWRGRLLLSALAHAAPLAGQAPSRDEASSAAKREGRSAAPLFLAIAELSGSGELRLAVGSANDRLQALQQAEASLIRTMSEELALLEESFAAGDFPHLRRLVADYHRRRERLVPEILSRTAPLT